MDETMLVILAGGQGSRMGGNKPLQPYAGTNLIEATLARLRPQVGNIQINARPDLVADLAYIGLPLVCDDPDFADLGPLSGVRTAVKRAADLGRDHVVTAPCDMPALPLDMIMRLRNEDADIVHFRGERDYPLCALWRTSLLPALDKALIAARPEGGVRVMRLIASQNSIALPGDPGDFININTLS